MRYYPLFAIISLLLINSCENRDINEGEQFQPREIHEDIVFHFDRIEVDGIEYLILEKDNNNPHEGFGFMAFRANKLMEKQDTVLAYLRTINEVQAQILAEVSDQPIEDVRRRTFEIFNEYLLEERQELEQLEMMELENRSINSVDSVN